VLTLRFVVLLAMIAATACGKKSPDTPGPTASGGPVAATNKEIVEALRQRSYDASETVPGVVVNLPDVYLFAFNSSAIGTDGRAKLKELATYLARPELVGRHVSIEGHTDNIGTDAVNQSLSERRAAAVRQELLAGGVPESRIVARGFGESKPVAPNTTPEGADDPAGRARNRRVEIVIENRR
jgi:outer membrane protein OmpA-like peptidoglycan-associated protein